MRKKFDLTSNLIKLDEKKETSNEFEKNVQITIKVSESYRKDLKVWCTQRGISITEAFKKAFDLLKENNK